MKLVYTPSLLLRLLFVQLIALAVIWALFSAYQFHNAQGEGRDSIEYDIELVATALAHVASVEPDGARVQMLAEQLRDVDVTQSDPPLRADQVAFRVWSADGTLLARSMEAPALPDLPMNSWPAEHHGTRGVWNYSLARSSGGNVVVLYAHAGSYYSGVGRAFVRDSARIYGILAIMLSILLWITLRLGLRPLNQLVSLVGTRPAEDLTPVRVATPYREIRPLIEALNEKMLRIRGVLDRERAFFADAAHELRTPLSAIAAQAHVLVAERETAQRDEAASALQSGVARAGRVRDRLLIVNRLDAAQVAGAKESVEIAEVAEDAVRDFRARAQATGHRIGIVAEPFMNRVDRENLDVAIGCLLDNALKYTPPGTQIIVSVHRDGAETVVSVSDNGPGIPPNLHERAFTRFERLGRTDQ